MKQIVAPLVVLAAALVVALPSGAGAKRNCKPNRATCSVDGDCCSGLCLAGACAASSGTSTSSTTTIVATTSTTTTTLRFVDNLNGTVTDNQTGLQWEKKDETCPGIHCVTDRYTWTSTGTAPDGTAFTSFLVQLNGGPTGVGNCTRSDDDGSRAGGFASHCDWRLPTEDELLTILDQERCATFVQLCIDPTFGPTAGGATSGEYWSADTLTRDPGVAWYVFFGSPGFTGEGFKTDANNVRAVRGGVPD